MLPIIVIWLLEIQEARLWEVMDDFKGVLFGLPVSFHLLKNKVSTILLIIILQGYLAPGKLHCLLLWKTI